jgi:hypothetical protein
MNIHIPSEQARGEKYATRAEMKSHKEIPMRQICCASSSFTHLCVRPHNLLAAAAAAVTAFSVRMQE